MLETKIIKCQEYIDNLNISSEDKSDFKVLCWGSYGGTVLGVSFETIAKYSELMKDYNFNE